MVSQKLEEIERTTIKGSKEKCDAFLNHPHRQALLRGEVPHTDDPVLLRKRTGWEDRRAAWKAEMEACTAARAAWKAEKAKQAPVGSLNPVVFLEDSDTEEDMKMAGKFM
jgi:hypothetical protein